MKGTISQNNFLRISAIIALFVFITLAVGSAWTHRPQVDEGLFANPAHNLAFNGHLGTTIFEKDTALTRIDQRTYWVMPLFLLNVAAVFKVFGYSLFAMRLVSVFWGIVLILSWYFISRNVFKNRNAALLTLILTATSYIVLETGSSGRMDLTCAALGFAGIASYLTLREKNLSLAVFASQLFVTASGLTHHNGILHFVALAFLMFYYDFRRLKPKHFAIAAIPYLVGGLFYGIYVFQDFQAFRDQFIDNAIMGGRMNGFSSPLQGIIAEFTDRYPHAFGLGTTGSEHSGPVYLKSLILIGYIVGFFGTLLSKTLRPLCLPILIQAVLCFLIMGVIDGQKETVYLIHIVPIFSALLAMWAVFVWDKNYLPKPIILLGITAFILLQTGGMALRIKQNTYANFYNPVIQYLKQNTGEDERIFGGVELFIGMNFSEKVSGDSRFGQLTGERAKFIVYDDAIHSSWMAAKGTDFYDYLPRLLNEEYKIAYENAAYKVYIRK